MTLPEPWRIRSMVEADVEAVLAIERESDTAPHWGEAEYLLALQSDKGSPLRRAGFVAEVGSEVAGFALVRLLTAPDGTEAELESIAVARRWRGRGLGRELLAEARRRCKSFGAGRVDLEVRASSEGAIRLYRRAGFQETGRRRGYYRAPEEDAVLMSATL